MGCCVGDEFPCSKSLIKVKTMLKSNLMVTLILISLSSATTEGIAKSKKRVPKFSDYLVRQVWQGKSAKMRVTTASDPLLSARFQSASKEPPNFAGHYRVVLWGCGSECINGGMVDLKIGRVLSPPLVETLEAQKNFNICQSAYAPSRIEFHKNSRLMIVHCGLNFVMHLNKNVPDAQYFVWDGKQFRLLRRLHLPNGQDKLLRSN
jgi:hypothetical protein